MSETGKDPETGKFTLGNRFWEARSSHGRKPTFPDADTLMDACIQYFEWVEANPLYAAETVKFQGKATITKVPKMRAMTISGLCNFLDISVVTWSEYRKNAGFSAVTTQVEQVISQQKFEGASADLLNANIIARDLGLADKREHTGNDGGPIKVEGRTWRDVLRQETDQPDPESEE